MCACLCRLKASEERLMQDKLLDRKGGGRLCQCNNDECIASINDAPPMDFR